MGEVIIGLLQTDPGSYLAASPGWRPKLPMRSGGSGDFRMVDFLTFARVDPSSRGQLPAQRRAGVRSGGRLRPSTAP